MFQFYGIIDRKPTNQYADKIKPSSSRHSYDEDLSVSDLLIYFCPPFPEVSISIVLPISRISLLLVPVSSKSSKKVCFPVFLSFKIPFFPLPFFFLHLDFRVTNQFEDDTFHAASRFHWFLLLCVVCPSVSPSFIKVSSEYSIDNKRYAPFFISPLTSLSLSLYRFPSQR